MSERIQDRIVEYAESAPSKAFDAARKRGGGFGDAIAAMRLKKQQQEKDDAFADNARRLIKLPKFTMAEFRDMLCDDAGKCISPDTCNAPGCYLHTNNGSKPHPPGPTPPPTPAQPTPPPTPPVPHLPADCSVGSDAFLPGVPGQGAPRAVSGKDGCAQACAQCTSLPCKYWKFGSNGNWCQFFADDKAGWPIAGAANDTASVVVSGTLAGNNCSATTAF